MSTPDELRNIRDHLRSGRFGQREVWERQLEKAATDNERLTALVNDCPVCRQLNTRAVSDIVERLRDKSRQDDLDLAERLLREAAADNRRLRAVITRAKDALLDGQSTQWVHDVLVAALTDEKGKP